MISILIRQHSQIFLGEIQLSRFYFNAFLSLLGCGGAAASSMGAQQAPCCHYTCHHSCLHSWLFCCCCSASYSFKFLKVFSCFAELQGDLVFRLLYLLNLLLFIICFAPIIYITSNHDGRILPFNILFPCLYSQSFVGFLLVSGC